MTKQINDMTDAEFDKHLKQEDTESELHKYDNIFVDNPIMNAKLDKQFESWAKKGKKK